MIIITTQEEEERKKMNRRVGWRADGTGSAVVGSIRTQSGKAKRNRKGYGHKTEHSSIVKP